MALPEQDQHDAPHGSVPRGKVPLDWVHRPAGGGFDSRARRYAGHGGSHPIRLLRPDRRAERAVSVWMLIDPESSRQIERLYGGGLGGAIAFEQVRGGSPVVELPPLLGDVREEFTVPAGTARAYLLEAGETVQVIDVAGQQCSDFMAMNARALHDGRERYIDSTATGPAAAAAFETGHSGSPRHLCSRVHGAWL